MRRNTKTHNLKAFDRAFDKCARLRPGQDVALSSEEERALSEAIARRRKRVATAAACVSLSLSLIASAARAADGWWLGQAAGGGGGGINDVVDDTSPTLGGSLDGGGFDITNLDDLTLNTITYDVAVSTCVDSGGTAGTCGSQYPEMATPVNADAGTLKVYNDSAIMAIFNQSGLVGNFAYTAGATVVDEEICRMDSTTGEKIQGTTGVAITDAKVMSSLNRLDILGGTDLANGIALGYIDGTPAAPVGTGFRIQNMGDNVAAFFPSGTIGTDIKYFVLADASQMATGITLLGSTASVGARVKFLEVTGNGTNSIGIGIGNATAIGTDFTVRAEQIGRVGTGATGITTYGPAIRGFSVDTTMDTGTLLCTVAFAGASFSANPPACIANSVNDYGAAGSTAFTNRDCGTDITTGNYFDVLCKVP